MSDNALDSLIETILKLKTREELKDFLHGILTPQELIEIPLRLEIVKMLKSGVAQRTISKKLGVGIATITRGSKELQKGTFENV